MYGRNLLSPRDVLRFISLFFSGVTALQEPSTPHDSARPSCRFSILVKISSSVHRFLGHVLYKSLISFAYISTVLPFSCSPSPPGLLFTKTESHPLNKIPDTSRFYFLLRQRPKTRFQTPPFARFVSVPII